MTQDILQAMHRRDNAKKKDKEDEYKQWRNHTTQLIKQAKTEHYKDAVETCKNNPNMLSNIFRELSHKNSGENTPTYINYKNSYQR